MNMFIYNRICVYIGFERKSFCRITTDFDHSEATRLLLLLPNTVSTVDVLTYRITFQEIRKRNMKNNTLNMEIQVFCFLQTLVVTSDCEKIIYIEHIYYVSCGELNCSRSCKVLSIEFILFLSC